MTKTSQNYINAYDFDHTIYRGDASFDFIVYCLLRHPSFIRYAPLQAWSILLYILGKRNRKQIKQVAFMFLKKLPDIDSEVNHFWMKHERKLEDWYLQQKQSNDIIVSASPEFLLKPIVTKLGIGPLIATRMDKHTGRIEGENCRGEEKIIRLKKLIPNPKFASAYSDTLSDLPLLNLAEQPYIVQKGTVMTLKQYPKKSSSHAMPGSKKALLRELFLYGIIGGSTAALDVLLFHLLTGVHVPLLIANFISVSTAVGSSFILNARYNFKKTDNFASRARKFFAIGYFGWFIQSIILLIGVDSLSFSETYVKIFAVFIAAAIQYLLNKFLTFRD